MLENIKEIFDFALPALEGLPVLRAILGIILVFFLPGFAWTLVFFRQVNIIERLALSLGLSIATVTLSILAISKLTGMRINGVNAVLVIILITVVPVIIYFISRYVRRRRQHGESADSSLPFLILLIAPRWKKDYCRLLLPVI